MSDPLTSAYPTLGRHLPRLRLAELPTPVLLRECALDGDVRSVAIKCDDVSNPHYGGNKIRKLEFILQRALERNAKRVATFGAAGSNHALATAVLAKEVGLGCTCFLAHQKPTPKVPLTLNMHEQLGTEIVRYGGSIKQLELFRRYLQGRQTWVVPMGGSSWLGSVGFVNAGLELAGQIAAGNIPCPERIYIAAGTMGSTAGLALGLAAAELPTELHAVCVVDQAFGNPTILDRLIRKTAAMLNRIDPSFDAGTADRVRLVWRGEFLAGGYAMFDERTDTAVEVARTELGLNLETTYTGKAMAALLHDLRSPDYDGAPYLFWNTYNSRTLPVTAARPTTLGNIPEDFERYYSLEDD